MSLILDCEKNYVNLEKVIQILAVHEFYIEPDYFFQN